MVLGVNKTGTSSAKFLSINPGAKAVGMGGAFTAIADDASCMYWNPSGIARLQGMQLYADHSPWLADINYDYLGVSLPISSNAAIGLNVVSMSMGEMDVRRYGNEDTGETFKVGSYALGTSWAMNLTDRFSIGFNAKYIKEQISNSSATGFAMDVGTLFNTIFGPTLGVSISNFGPKMRMRGSDLLVNVDISEIEGNNPNINAELSTDYFDLPLMLRVGLADGLKFGPVQVTWSVDAVNPNDNSEYLNVGCELNFFKMVYIRAGSKAMFMDEREELFTVGGGAKLGLNSGWNLKIDYVYEVMENLPDIHKYSLGFTF
jgi:hypothetical protein